MIPRFGRILPFIIAMLGIVDVKYAWYPHRNWSIFVAIVTVFLIYFMFKNHASTSPKRSLRNIFVPLILMIAILWATYIIFF
ncbi:MAG TPA: hypothetical protein VL335_03305 [Candidatus Paceibacterota bacterium]|nr:hypothetical protein [Candidatus Paceibacterota bacterium]